MSSAANAVFYDSSGGNYTTTVTVGTSLPRNTTQSLALTEGMDYGGENFSMIQVRLNDAGNNEESVGSTGVRVECKSQSATTSTGASFEPIKVIHAMTARTACASKTSALMLFGGLVCRDHMSLP